MNLLHWTIENLVDAIRRICSGFFVKMRFRFKARMPQTFPFFYSEWIKNAAYFDNKWGRNVSKRVRRFNNSDTVLDCVRENE